MKTSGSQGKRQKNGQEDQVIIKELGMPPLIVCRSPALPGRYSPSSLGSLELDDIRLHNGQMLCKNEDIISRWLEGDPGSPGGSQKGGLGVA